MKKKTVLATILCTLFAVAGCGNAGQADADAGIFGSQIDLLIVRKDQIINLCEMKYSETDYIVSAAFIKDQKRKIHDFRQITGTKYAIHSTLITTYAVENNAYAGELQAVITAEDLFR